jgi:hypothetical protein
MDRMKRASGVAAICGDHHADVVQVGGVDLCLALLRDVAPAQEKTTLCLNFPYVCPEPVLAK